MSSLDPLPFAARLHWHFSGGLYLPSWQVLFSLLLEYVAVQCESAGPYVIGHIKALARFPEGGYIRVSTISSTRPPSVEVGGIVPEVSEDLLLTINVLVHGLPLAEARRIVGNTAAGLALARAGEVTVKDASLQAGHSYHQR
jgi:hypothetical protein